MVSATSDSRVAKVVAVLFVGMLGLAGCTPQTASTPEIDVREYAMDLSVQLADSGHLEDAALLADGALTEDEYFEAAYRFKSCKTEAGLTLEGPFVNPADGLQLLWIPQEQPNILPDRAASADCDFSWAAISSAYISLHDNVMDAQLAEAVARCLTENGIGLSGDEKNFADFAGPSTPDGGLSERVKIAESCVFEEADVLFPGQPIAITF